MPNEYYDIGMDDSSAPEKAAALARALRSKEQLGTVLALSGAQSFQPGSHALLGQAQQGNEFLGTAGANHVKGVRELEKFAREMKIKSEQTGYDRGQDVIKHREHDAATNAQAAIAASNNAIAKAQLGIHQNEADVKAKDRADKLAAINIDTSGGVFEGKPGIGDTVANQARESAGHYDAAISGMNAAEELFAQLVENPTPENYNALSSTLLDIAASANTASGGGAMSKDELENRVKTMGFDFVSPTGLRAIMSGAGGDKEEAKKILLTKLRSEKSVLEKQMQARLRARGYTYKPTAPAQTPKRVKLSTGEIVEVE